jgi:hypothetical protein
MQVKLASFVSRCAAFTRPVPPGSKILVIPTEKFSPSEGPALHRGVSISHMNERSANRNDESA